MKYGTVKFYGNNLYPISKRSVTLAALFVIAALSL